MSKVDPVLDWREARRESARAAILAVAWEVVEEDGLAGLSLRDLARRAGITTPTVYAYFASKNDIYDAMFGQAAEAFALHMTAPHRSDDPRDLLIEALQRFFEFCLASVPRYQLLFQHVIPGFTPSAESYSPAQRALDSGRDLLARNSITDDRHLDILTAITTGLVSQQIANDPGGERWTSLIDDTIDMFLNYCQPPASSRRRRERR